MEAAELARWTRFAAKGGIGRCTAICDCVAENPGDLMFLKDDEITVLMQIVEKPGTYVGYCEGVVGRFQGADVQFHSKLKKLVKTKRSSLSAATHSQGKSPTPSNGSHPNSPALLPADSRRARVSLDEEVAQSIRPLVASPTPIFTSETPSISLPRRAPSRERISRSRLDDLVAVTPDAKEVPLPVRSPSPITVEIAAPPEVSSPEPLVHHVAGEPDPEPPLVAEVKPATPEPVQPLDETTLSPSTPPKAVVPRAVAPLRTSSLKRSNLAPSRTSLASSRHESMASSYSQDDDTVLGHGDQIIEVSHPPTIDEVPESPPSAKPSDSMPITPPTAVPDTSMSAFFDTSRISTHSDGETGIGLSLLQNLADTEGFGDWSDSDSDTQLVRRRSSKKKKTGSVRRTKSGRSARSVQASLARNDSVASRGLMYGSDSDSEDGLRYDDSDTGHDTIHDHVAQTPALATIDDRLEDELNNTHAQFATASVLSSRVASPTEEEMTFPPTAPLSPNRARSSRPSPTTFVFPSPPSHHPNASVQLGDRRPSIAHSQASTSSMRDDGSVDDESMMDIYDNYRYSRFSVGGASLAASARRMSAASRRMSASSSAPWMSASSKPVPLPWTEHLDSRPRVDSTQSGTDSKKSMDLPNPFDSAPEDAVPERPRFGRSRSNTSASIGPRPPNIFPASSAPTSPLPSPPLPPMPAGIIARAEAIQPPKQPKEHPAHAARGSDSDSSVYTQASVNNRPTSNIRLSSHAASTKNEDSPPAAETATASAPAAHRPAPLDLSNDTRQSTNSDSRSPLLHMTWAPLSSPPPEATATIGNLRGYTGTGDGFTGLGKGQDTPESASFFPGVGEGGFDRLSKVMSEGQNSAVDEEDSVDGDGEMSADKGERRVVIEDDEDEVVIGQRNSEHSTSTSTPAPPSAIAVPSEAPATVRSPPPASSGDVLTTPATVDIQRPPTLALPGQPMARPPRPSLAELRGANPGEPEGMRQSLFLPHPNAPKAPSAHSPGPMYIAQQLPPPPQQQVRNGAIQTIRMALSTPPRGFNAHRGPTIYGRMTADLLGAAGPVPISFSLEPPPATAPPPGSVPKTSSSPVPPIRVTGSPLPRTPSPLVAQKTDDRPLSVDTKGAIPRANFYPKAAGIRPRSRSFSGFSSPTTEVPMPVQKSREEGSGRPEIPSAADVKDSLLNIQPTPPSPSASSPKPSPLRGSSPLARSSGSLGPPSKPQPPSSPLSQFTFPRESIQVPPSPTTSSNRPIVLRAATSRPTLQDSSPSKSIPQIRNVASDVALVKTSETRSSIENDRASVRSSRSNIASPTPHGLGRQSSLRAKLSLPNLRRTASRQDEPSSPLSDRHGDGDMVQVKHMDFELIRPTLPHFQAARSSEDSGVLGRDTSLDIQRDSRRLRPESPAISMSSPLSPTFPSGSPPAPALPPVHANDTLTGSPRPSDSESSLDAHRNRELKWMGILSSVAPSQSRKSKKVKKLLLEGVPSSVRYLVWSHLTDGKSRIVPNVYSQLGARAKVPAIGDIERDVNRCFAEYSHLKRSQGPVLSLLQAYLTMVPDIRYSTGLTLIAGHLLLLAPEEDAFWIFVSVMDSHLRPYFSVAPIQIEIDSTLFSKAVEAADPTVAKKIFVDMGIPPSAVCRPWFTQLFVGTLPQQYLDRIWDIFLYEGVPFLLRVGLALFNCLRRKLLECMSPEAALALLQAPVPALLPPSPDALVSLALAAKLKDEDFKKQRVKLEGQIKRQTQAPRPAGSISLPRA